MLFTDKCQNFATDRILEAAFYIDTERRNYMRQEKFKMERQGLINVGDEIEISEYQSFMNYSYIIEPAVAMSGCYPNAERIRSRTYTARFYSDCRI